MSERKRMSDTSQSEGTVLLPLFPLRLVLFPGQLLPLHIFEPRYRLMINQCIEAREPFGVVLMRDDTPDWRDYQGEVVLPHDVGTTAHIRQVERLDDGRINVVTLGLHRFRVRKLRFDQPFLQGEVESFPLAEEADQSVTPSAEAVRRHLRSYMEVLSKVADAEIDLDDIPRDPRALAFLAAAVVQVPWEDKQDLLEMPELATLLESERQLLRHEKMLLSFMHSTQDRLEDLTLGVTGYLFPN